MKLSFMCGIFCLWYHVCTQEVFGLGAFQITVFEIGAIQPVTISKRIERGNCLVETPKNLKSTGDSGVPASASGIRKGQCRIGSRAAR